MTKPAPARSGRNLLAALVLATGLCTAGIAMASGYFSYGGISLDDSLERIAPRYPRSTLVDGYLYLAPGDVHDHIHGVVITGNGGGREARFNLERPKDPGKKEPDAERFATCEDIAGKLRSSYGAPAESGEAELHWSRGGEQLTLVCFRGEGGVSFASAVRIRRS